MEAMNNKTLFSPTVNPDQIIFQARACTLLLSVIVTFPRSRLTRCFLKAIHRNSPIPDNIDSPPPHRVNKSLSEGESLRSTLANSECDAARGSNLR